MLGVKPGRSGGSVSQLLATEPSLLNCVFQLSFLLKSFNTLNFIFVYFVFFETSSLYLTQAGLGLEIVLLTSAGVSSWFTTMFHAGMALPPTAFSLSLMCYALRWPEAHLSFIALFACLEFPMCVCRFVHSE